MIRIPLFGGSREFAGHEDEIMAAVCAVLASGEVVGGEPVAALEREMARRTGRRYAVAVNSGTDALHFALRAAGVGSGDDVLVTDFSFVSSASGIALTGARPVFVDVDETYNMDLEDAASRLTPRTRALVFVHLYGQMGDPAKIESFAQSHGLILIEDAAQAIGASFHDRPSGSLGLVSCLSFNSTKPIAAPGGGGMILTDDNRVAARVKRLRYHGKAPSGEFVELGFNSLMAGLTAAALNFKLTRNEEWLHRRREIAAQYERRLREIEDIIPPQETPGGVHIYHKFVVRSAERDGLQAHLDRMGIETKVHYPTPLHREPVFAALNGSDASYPCAEEFARTVLSLPMHPFLTAAEVDEIADGIALFARHHVMQA